MNIPLLKRLQTQLEKMPIERFNQKGMWASIDDQGRVIPGLLGLTLLLQDYMVIGDNEFAYVPTGKKVANPRLAAEKELGLTHREAADLFTFRTEVPGLHNPRNIAKWIGEIIETGRVRIPRNLGKD